jgi:phosphoribosylformylglycinamidine synthase
MFLARVYVTLKPTVNDPQGRTILGGLKSLGFDGAEDVRAGKYLEIKLDAGARSEAEALVDEMCQRLLANPVIESYRYDVEEAPA